MGTHRLLVLVSVSFLKIRPPPSKKKQRKEKKTMQRKGRKEERKRKAAAKGRAASSHARVRVNVSEFNFILLRRALSHARNVLEMVRAAPA